MEITYKPEPGKRWIPYYIEEKPVPPTVELLSADGTRILAYKTLRRCPICGGSHIKTKRLGDLSDLGDFDLTCDDCKKKIGQIRDWIYYPHTPAGIWTDDELNDYRLHQTMERMDEIKKDFSDPDDGMKIHKTKSGKYIVVEGII